MGKLLVLIVLVAVAFWLLRRALRRVARSDDAAKPNAKPQAGAKPQADEELVRCAHCALLLPRGEARQADGAIYCSEEHAKLGPGAR